MSHRDLPTTLRLAATALLISGLLHFLAPVLAGFAQDALPLLFFGVLYIVLARRLNGERRRLAWFVYCLILFFSVVAFVTMTSSSVPQWCMMAIILADWIALGGLFAFLWQSRESPVAAT